MLAGSAFAALAALTAFLAESDAYADVINPEHCELPMSQGLRRAAERLEQCVASKIKAGKYVIQKTGVYSIF